MNICESRRITCPFLFLIAFVTSCNGQPSSSFFGISQSSGDSFRDDRGVNPKAAEQIDQYVVSIFEDSKGNLWFGTLSKGAARYDGNKLSYISDKDGLPGNSVVGFAEDKQGNIWIATHSGLAKYNGSTLTSFTSKDGLCDDRLSGLLVDHAGTIWVCTWSGVCKYNGTGFSAFRLPRPDVKLFKYQASMNWVTEMLEDKQGNIWFCTDGYGVCKYDGKSFTHLTKKDGLASNNVQAIAEDNSGNIWLGSRMLEKDNPDPNGRTGDGGLSRYDGKTIVQYPEIKGLSKNDIYAIQKDHAGNIWIGANGVGAYRYDGHRFTLFSETDRRDLMIYGYGIQDILEDRNGKLWFGLSGGLFRLKDSSIVNVTTNGPWD